MNHTPSTPPTTFPSYPHVTLPNLANPTTSPNLSKHIVLKAWGSGVNGNIANFGYKSSQTPIDIILPDEPVKRVFSNGSETTFALTHNDSLYSWGRGENWVLGTGHSVNTSAPSIVNIPPVLKLQTSATHTAAITKAGDVYTWGGLALGRGKSERDLTQTEKATPTRVILPVNRYGHGILLQDSTSVPQDLAVGQNHTIVSMGSGHVYGWGDDCDGTLGLGDKKKRYASPTPIPIPEDEKVEAVAAGKRHSLFKTFGGSVYACGQNSSGQCGVSSHEETAIRAPRKIQFPPNPLSSERTLIKQISCGNYHSCAVSTQGDLFCWGSNDSNQLGLALSTRGVQSSLFKSFTPMRNEFFAASNIKIDKVACGGSHTAVITEDNQLYLFGRGKDGQLSDLDRTSCSAHDTPVHIVVPHMEILDVELGNNTTYVVGRMLEPSAVVNTTTDTSTVTISNLVN